MRPQVGRFRAPHLAPKLQLVSLSNHQPSGNAATARVLRGDHGECVMKRLTDRRTVLMTAGAAAVAAAAGPVAAQSTDIRGAVTFEGGAVIPEGHLEIYLEDTAIQDNARRRARGNAHQKRRRVKGDRIFLVRAGKLDCFANAADRCAPGACGWLAARAGQRAGGGGFAGQCHAQHSYVLKGREQWLTAHRETDVGGRSPE